MEFAQLFEKADALSIKVLSRHRQKAQLKNPNIKITLEALTDAPPLEQVAIISEGLHTGDYPRFGRNFWEIPKILGGWSPQQGGGSTGEFCSGFENILFWEEGNGELIRLVQERLGTKTVTQWVKGEKVWGKCGIAVGMMGNLRSSFYQGTLFTHGICAIVRKS